MQPMPETHFGFPIEPRRKVKYDPAAHAISEFSTGVLLAMESGDEKAKVDVASVTKELVLALQAQKQGVHPITYLSLSFVLTLAFFSGVLWTRVEALETKTSALEQVQVIGTKVDAMQQELSRIRDRLEEIPRQRR